MLIFAACQRQQSAFLKYLVASAAKYCEKGMGPLQNGRGPLQNGRGVIGKPILGFRLLGEPLFADLGFPFMIFTPGESS